LRGQSVRLGAVAVNAWRTVFAAICFVIIFLRERPSPRGIVGTLLSVAGIALVI